MTTLSSEELQAQRSDFGLRLSNSMAKYGPLCVGIDPHRKLLTTGDTTSTPKAPELFSMRMLQAANGRAAAVKFQTPMFERYGAKGFEALERVLYAARQMASSPSSIACAAAVHHDFRHRRRLFQARCTVAGRRHHAAAVLWRAFVERPDYRSAGKRTRRVHRLPDLQPGRHESADRVAPERRLQGTYRGLRHRLHRAEA